MCFAGWRNTTAAGCAQHTLWAGKTGNYYSDFITTRPTTRCRLSGTASPKVRPGIRYSGVTPKSTISRMAIDVNPFETTRATDFTDREILSYWVDLVGRDAL